MLSDHQRRLEIGSHKERLDTVKALGELDTREACDLLKLAAEDVDPQIRETAEKFMRESIWYSGSGSSAPSEAPAEEPETGQETLF